MVEGICFEYDRMSDTLMMFCKNVKLSFNINLGFKDKDGNKETFMKEYRYKSNKYKNTRSLISIKRNIKTYLTIEYPENDIEGNQRLTRTVYINHSGILGLRDKLNKFDKYIKKAYSIRKGELVLIESNVTYAKSTPYDGNTIEVVNDIYSRKDEIGRNINEVGVRFILNGEYQFIVPITVWKSFLYYVNTCDFYGWGITLADSLCARMLTETVCDFTENSGEGYIDNNINENMSGSINRTKPLHREDKIKSFFDD